MPFLSKSHEEVGAKEVEIASFRVYLPKNHMTESSKEEIILGSVQNFRGNEAFRIINKVYVLHIKKKNLDFVCGEGRFFF